MNVPEIVVDDETTATNPHSKRQSILGFFGKTKQRFRSPSPAARSGDVKIESLVNSFAWTDEIPTQKGLAEFKSKIKWVQKGQRVLNVEQKCEYERRVRQAVERVYDKRFNEGAATAVA